MYKEVFKLRIKARREELALTQSEVSNETEIEQSKISKYETGNLEPNIETLGKLANYYKISTDWLIGNIHHGKEGNLVKAALEELNKEIVTIIEGAAEQNFDREEEREQILINIEKARQEIAAKYTHI